MSVPSGSSEIYDLLTTYAFGLDRRDFDAVAGVFTEDAVVENVFDTYLPEGATFASTTIGGSAVAEGARALFTRIDATQHLLGAQTVEITGTTARASTQIVAHHHKADGYYHTGGTYEDELVQTSDGWRISRRTLRISWTTGNPGVFA
ncbi:nuclear transport factor 2 family protein [Rhodococcoides yunnanense]|uniref:nuclear transport factor 2 family protein n=1 Tax=Rhodococcoides yunnanense TaxID=278209 RepID=UPI000933B32F|nr:nuclear transport factor 2 family protein [Rhodococcus yunnanensis]